MAASFAERGARAWDVSRYDPDRPLGGCMGAGCMRFADVIVIEDDQELCLEHADEYLERLGLDPTFRRLLPAWGDR